MMNLSTGKRMAAEILKCGKNKVWIDPQRQEDVDEAITKADVRRLIQDGAIKKRRENQQSRGRARKNLNQRKKGRRSGHGSRRGARGAREKKKSDWMTKVRAQRKLIKEMRDSGQMSKENYREIYRKVKGGFFSSKRNLKNYLKREGMIEEEG